MQKQYVVREVAGIPEEVYKGARYATSKYDGIREAFGKWVSSLDTAKRKDWSENAVIIECANKREMTCIQTTIKNTRRKKHGKCIQPPRGYRFITRSTPVTKTNRDGAYYLYVAVEPVSA